MLRLLWTVVGLLVVSADPIVPRLMNEGDIAGLSIAILQDGRVSSVKAYGVRNMNTRTLVSEHTVFEAASLSKPVFSYAVLQLVDAQKLSLDEPLSNYLPNYVSSDNRAAAITARQVLSHTTGFPNWRGKQHPMKTYFPPGERFSYSGEGYVYLQKVVEKITGEPLDSLMKRLVFDPLEMRNSSYLWQARFDDDHADPHDSALRPGAKRKPTEANAAASLHTTAGDYARFVEAALSGAGLKKETAREWFKPQVILHRRCSECIEPDIPDVETHMAWGLGWGLEPDQDTFLHWGDNGGFKCFIMGSFKDRNAVVVLTNTDTGLSIMPELIASLLPGNHPVFAWLRYERYDTPRKLLLRSALARGIEAAWRDSNGTALDESERRATARDLVNRNRLPDALWLRKHTVSEFPRSSRAHGDLGESYLAANLRKAAARELSRAIELDPENLRAASFLKLIQDGLFPWPFAKGRVTLRLKGHLDAKQVFAAGSFNLWDVHTLPMVRDAQGWAVRFDLPPGQYEYRFVLDGMLIPDPGNPRHKDPNDSLSASLLRVERHPR